MLSYQQSYCLAGGGTAGFEDEDEDEELDLLFDCAGGGTAGLEAGGGTAGLEAGGGTAGLEDGGGTAGFEEAGLEVLAGGGGTFAGGLRLGGGSLGAGACFSNPDSPCLDFIIPALFIISLNMALAFSP